MQREVQITNVQMAEEKATKDSECSRPWQIAQRKRSGSDCWNEEAEACRHSLMFDSKDLP
jgi:hypothetical protein